MILLVRIESIGQVALLGLLVLGLSSCSYHLYACYGDMVFAGRLGEISQSNC